MGNAFTPRPGMMIGLDFTQKYILKLGIIFLGIRLGFEEFLKFGTVAIPLIIVCILSVLILVKLTANPLTVKGMGEHIDCDVSKILSREMTMSQAGDELIKSMIRVANGRLTCAEALGHKEFVMTKLYRSA